MIKLFVLKDVNLRLFVLTILPIALDDLLNEEYLMMKIGVEEQNIID